VFVFDVKSLIYESAYNAGHAQDAGRLALDFEVLYQVSA
jgi:hypothetical protein